MTTINAETVETKNKSGQWLDWIDAKSIAIGDRLNPLLVKETRQALKSRQFVITFSLLLIAALGWTIIGSIMLMPDIYTTPSAPRMLIGYYVVLAIPLLLVVPLAAYRSLEAEIDDGTLELLSITSLSPWQIVLGKLASAALQMLLYFVALFPCVAYAYTLRGVDLPTTLLMVLILAVVAMLLTTAGLFFAPLGRTRSARILTMLGLFIMLAIAEFMVGALVINMIENGNSLPLSLTVYFVIAGGLVAISIGVLLLCTTAAQLTPESENSSTPVRLALLSLTTVIIGLSGYGLLVTVDSRENLGAPISIAIIGLFFLWTFCSGIFVAESPTMTPRIRRELPSSFMSRLMLTWLTPGPGTGLVFSVVSMAVMVGVITFGLVYLTDTFGAQTRALNRRFLARTLELMVMYVSYVTCFLVFVRWIIGMVRRKNNPRAEVGFAALIVVAVAAALIPYGVEMHFNDYRDFQYSKWQITNWAWTLQRCSDGRLFNGEVYKVLAAAISLFIASLLTMPSTVLPRRIATPERVLEEREKAKAV